MIIPRVNVPDSETEDDNLVLGTLLASLISAYLSQYCIVIFDLKTMISMISKAQFIKNMFTRVYSHYVFRLFPLCIFKLGTGKIEK